MGWDSFAMWDCEQDHMGWSGEVDGTVQVSTGVRECFVGRGYFGGKFEPPDDNFDLELEVISAVMEDIDEPDEHFNLGGEIFVSTNNEDVDYFPFIRIFLPHLILPEISPLFLSAESEDTIFDPGISK
nr:hypothetical protein [Tanacetum cinerariifolium]